MSTLAQHFHTRFDVLTDGSQALKDQAFKLRYQVYCLERGHAAEVTAADCRERDAFDDFALHAVVQDRRCGTDKATVRLIPAGHTRSERFPIEQVYPELFARHGVTEEMLPRQATAEISRFAVSKERRERAARPSVETADRSRLDTRVRDLPGGAANRRPLVTFGLLLGLIRMGAANDITHCLAVMEPSLLRLLARFGIHFKPIGGLVEYHGFRQPCYTSVSDLLAGVQAGYPELWELLTCDTQTPPVRSTQTSDSTDDGRSSTRLRRSAAA